MTIIAGSATVAAAHATRIDQAICLTPAERREVMAAFFSSHPGCGNGPLGLGQAILDFQEWECDSGRIGVDSGSDWWRAVNGMMVLDVRAAASWSVDAAPAVHAWRDYASNDVPDEAQALLWAAHQRSLHQAIAVCRDGLEAESMAEQVFAAIVIDVVDRTALANRPTDTPDLAKLTKRYYPASYPVAEEDLLAVEGMRRGTAEHLCDSNGLPYRDVGMNSRRWST